MTGRPAVAVVGGGIAGLAAALSLAEEGFAVSLFERRALLGGRASSFEDPASGELVDNCQHVSLRCCTNLDDFLRRVGASDAVPYCDRIDFLDPEGRRSSLRAGSLPAPFHLLPSLLRFRALSLREKWRLVRVAWTILRSDRGSEELERVDFRSWLLRHGQGERAIRLFWSPLLVSALNEEVERASARAALQVVFEGLLKNRRGFHVGLPRVPLAAIYSEKGLAALASRGVRVGLRRNAVAIEVAEGRATAIRFADGSREAAGSIVAAVPFPQLRELLPAEARGFLAPLAGLQTSPILGIHLWFDRTVTTPGFAALLGRRMQWAFAKEAGRYLCLVVSAARDFERPPKEEIVETALREVRECFPAAREARLLKALVVRERNATFSPAPGAEALRPGAATPVRGLFLAGDWTACGWPATMEGAARSGYLAAEALLGERGIERRIVRDPLPAGRLVRRFAKA